MNSIKSPVTLATWIQRTKSASAASANISAHDLGRRGSGAGSKSPSSINIPRGILIPYTRVANQNRGISRLLDLLSQSADRSDDGVKKVNAEYRMCLLLTR